MTARVESVLTKLKIVFEPKAKQGRIWGYCPLHEDEHMGSFFVRVSPIERYGQFHCFVCKEGGTLTELVSQVRGLSLSGAQDWLDAFEDQVAEPEPTPDIVSVEEIAPTQGFRLPREVILEPFNQWVTPARKYMQDRCVTPWQVTLHRLGYAVDGRLAGRIVIPIWTTAGVASCYQARDFCGQGKRYLFPSGAEHPNLDTLFGEAQWTTQRAQVVVTEGAFNALAVERAIPERSGIAFCALGSSSFRPAHAFKLATFEQVIVMTDSDQAGDDIAEKLQAALSRHARVKRMRLEKGDANDQPEWRLRMLLRTACATA